MSLSPILPASRGENGAERGRSQLRSRRNAPVPAPFHFPARTTDVDAPLRHADKVTSAMFITWGEFDDPELIGQSKDMASSVERNHVQVETMSFLDESFGVRHLSHKLDLY